MANDGYQEALRQLVKEAIDDLINDVVGLAEWKIRQKGNDSAQGQYGTAEFPSDSGSPLSTFSSTPNSRPRSLTFNNLAGTQLTDNEDDQNKSNKDEELVKYLIGEISESEDENLPDLRVNLNLHVIEDNTNLHDVNQLHEITQKRTPMVPIEANIIIETVKESEKVKERVVSKGKKKVTGRGDHSIQKQHEICKHYIKMGKDLSKLKTYLRKQIAKSKNTYSMPRTNQTPTKAQR